MPSTENVTILCVCVHSFTCVCEAAHVYSGRCPPPQSLVFENDPSLNLELTSSETWACQEVPGVSCLPASSGMTEATVPVFCTQIKLRSLCLSILLSHLHSTVNLGFRGSLQGKTEHDSGLQLPRSGPGLLPARMVRWRGVFALFH